VKRKTHKERAQPAARAKFGLLEKHKDYVQRARDFHRKQGQLKILREKAAFRNPDEFYFKMQSSSTKRGVHQVNRDNSLDDDTIKLLKSQDMNYVKMKLQTEKRKLDKLEGDLHCLSAMAAIPKQNKHTIFLDSDEEPEDLDLAEYFDTVPELLDQSHNRQRKDQLEEYNEPKIPGRTLKKMQKEKERRYLEITEREKRKRKLERAAKHLETERLLMGKGKKRKIKKAENGQPAQYVWRQERKR